MKMAVRESELHVLNMWTRMPFRYGIATLTALPHLFLRLTVEWDGRAWQGLASEGLPPKWFTKDPQAAVGGEILDMISVIRAASRHAVDVGAAASVFDLWREIYRAQEVWAASTRHPPLLWVFGVTLVERALLDAFCKASRTTLHRAVRDDRLGIRLGSIHARLTGARPRDFLPAEPSRRITIRHTVGLADPLADDGIPPSERLDDGLPQSLAACIDQYGLTHFKIKLPADVDVARDRLLGIAAILGDRPSARHAFTLDCNEFFQDAAAFRDFWESLRGTESIARFLQRGLLFVEQPLHRDVALSDPTARAWTDWPSRPAIIIDESDAELDSLPRALECGYAGTSHKNCKGVFKGIANGCLIASRSRRGDASGHVMSGEDLANVGPVALLQDLAVCALLGLTHAERNGHHYFAGLSAFPPDVHRDVLRHHGDLYHQHQAGSQTFPTLTIQGGAVQLDSVNLAPFGCALDVDVSRYVPLDDWRVESLQLTA
jgi:hypothetical protein